jgi:CHAD domain-containing protein
MNLQTSREALWRARLDAVVRAWPQMRRGNAKAVHQARVASRRIREALPMIAAGLDRPKLRRLSRKVRDVTRALGPVRALDVELVVLADLERSMPSHRAAIALVRKHLVAGRRALRKRMMERVDGIDLKTLVGKLARLSAGRDARSGRRAQNAMAWRNVLVARTVRRAARLREAIDQAGSLYVPERLHAVRIAAKKLRYVLEVADEAAVPRVSALIQSLKAVQGTLGRLHDLQSLLDRGRDVQAAIGTKPGRADLKAFMESLERECRRLHAEYVVRHEELLRVCDRSRREVARQIVVGRPRAARVATARGRQGAAAMTGDAGRAAARAGEAARSDGRRG